MYKKQKTHNLLKFVEIALYSHKNFFTVFNCALTYLSVAGPYEWYPDNCPSGHHPERYNPEWTQSRMDSIQNEHLPSHFGVLYASLVRRFYKDAFDEKLFFLRNVSHL